MARPARLSDAEAGWYNPRVLAELLGGENPAFRSRSWPTDLALFHSDPAWFARLSSIAALTDPDEWLDRAPELMSFRSLDLLGRREARRRFLDGESIYIVGLERTVAPLREMCDGLAADLAVNPADVVVQAWAAGGPTSVGMHFDLDYNFNVQLAGRKAWAAAPNTVVAHPISSHHVRAADPCVTDTGRALPTEMPADARTWDAAPGDVVYLPQGMWHATRTTEATLAMSFVVQPPTWADHIARTVRDRLHADARWRERVMGGRNLAEHRQLRTTAADALAASRDILAQVGPSEVLYLPLWGKRPAFFTRSSAIAAIRLEAVECAGLLTWTRSGDRVEVPVPMWALAPVQFMMKAPGSWSMAVLHDLVNGDDVVFLSVLVARLVDAGFLLPAPAPHGGVARGGMASEP